jgi:hypothetical protein
MHTLHSFSFETGSRSATLNSWAQVVVLSPRPGYDCI